MTTKYLIARCILCGEVWAVDYMPDPCVDCIDADYDEVWADDFRSAVKAAYFPAADLEDTE